MAWERWLTRRAGVAGSVRPLIELRLFRSAGFTWGTTLATLVSFAMFVIFRGVFKDHAFLIDIEFKLFTEPGNRKVLVFFHVRQCRKCQAEMQQSEVLHYAMIGRECEMGRPCEERGVSRGKFEDKFSYVLLIGGVMSVEPPEFSEHQRPGGDGVVIP